VTVVSPAAKLKVSAAKRTTLPFALDPSAAKFPLLPPLLRPGERI